MSRYFIVCRLRWPALLLLTGIIALLDQMDILTWGHAWPLYLILLGVLALAERAALAAEPPAGYPYAAGYQAAGYAPGYAPPAGAYAGSPAAPSTSQPVQPASTGIVPAHTDLEIQSTDPDNTPGREPRKSWEEEGR
ncbi:hypothetical protein [Acidicapsa acidisoli]|uniref:hypothetical protein n=1 Tax=Acidicapsa acidisoli TaxID=1615681 RepID=UPI0021E00ACD|nr:hypothetical protein [Acidicapsa acidisoli]